MNDNKPISFRVSAHHRELLERGANEAGLSSPDLFARKIVLEHLDAESEDSIKERLRVIEQELIEARRDLSVATEVLLIHAGTMNQVSAEAWVGENLKPR